MTKSKVQNSAPWDNKELFKQFYRIIFMFHGVIKLSQTNIERFRIWLYLLDTMFRYVWDNIDSYSAQLRQESSPFVHKAKLLLLFTHWLVLYVSSYILMRCIFIRWHTSGDVHPPKISKEEKQEREREKKKKSCKIMYLQKTNGSKLMILMRWEGITQVYPNFFIMPRLVKKKPLEPPLCNMCSSISHKIKRNNIVIYDMWKLYKSSLNRNWE